MKTGRIRNNPISRIARTADKVAAYLNSLVFWLAADKRLDSLVDVSDFGHVDRPVVALAFGARHGIIGASAGRLKLPMAPERT